MKKTYAHYQVVIATRGEPRRVLTLDIPNGAPIPAVGENVEICYNGFSVSVKRRSFNHEGGCLIDLGTIAERGDRDDDWGLPDWKPWYLDLGDCSNELHSAGWES